MRGSFGVRIDVFKETLGNGRLVGTVEVDQVYAHYQHEGATFKHPGGGKAFFLRDPLFEGSDGFMQHLADDAIQEEGSEVELAMIENMEDLGKKVVEQSPVEFGSLRNSDHPVVTSDGFPVYDRPPIAARLSEEQLKQRGKLRNLLPRSRRR